MICVFDIETVPDVDLLRKKFGYTGSELEICLQAFEDQKNKSGSEFLPIAFHKIISIASVVCDEYGKFEKVGVFGRKQEVQDSYIEEVTLGDFLKWFNKAQPRLVSFNGRGFDLPTMMLRAMKYNMESLAYFEQDNSLLNKNKWENYRQRYSERFHTDLLDSLGHFGSVRGLRLDDVSSLCGLPGKYDVSGDDVFSLYYAEKNLKKIDEYCQSDVLNTYWVYLKYEVLKGNLTLRDYVEILQDWKDKLPKDKEYSEIFNEHLQKEIEKCTM
ncbi:3'-5' exonuclease [Helicobacter kayseriensis]|uniref:3'-5' exonuclease n=1 Tax=Helicobacter kayseriensis TaxID=2905877 RepID=UPI001E510C78|nr:3'-5' exonuclease [Helicobacter kayseriensis]MCE3047171.1 3'-5' exonuclease [Helicobacter kayseriensis]MCE3048542.1 3'-5' exonuclease [Helicobacter kayseriensis]